MTRSMTAFASGTGSREGYSWSWDVRSVNARGLDLRVRVPDWLSGLETALRQKLSGALARGNVTLNLRINREDQGSSLRINAAQLRAVLTLMQQVEAQAQIQGIALQPARATDILHQRGVLEQAGAEGDANSQLAAALAADFDAVLAEFLAMRIAEGTALSAVLAEQLDRIETLTRDASRIVRARADRIAAHHRAALDRVADSLGPVEPERIAQELAMLAIKADVSEELDRLHAHIGAARDLLAQEAPVGRRLDFLTQEFNREANTLCAKAQDTDLTALGLELKAVIDQLREQVQNIE
ncbi:YicC/YloC family endoribonuclease [Pseudooceanicola aestuarii]|uniref:YicC/YloC family endoribonuclease n=1 Tax=Pseudooceanicola aestuarii TaxID=2697319 RepID=UPI0013D26537|nr:YicC/YloC family endoribonuclease [Pseudooceanicola aestuarii]